MDITALRNQLTTEPTKTIADSVALARLMEEVRNNTDRQPTAYNRMHNRHNR